jgi:hypothetical protein
MPRMAKNVPGPFYTTGQCLACGAPEHEAPELFASLDDGNYEPTSSASLTRRTRSSARAKPHTPAV